MTRVSFATAAALLCLVPAPATAAPFDDEPIVRAMHDELARTMDALALPDAPKPYYVSYSVFDRREVGVEASFGALVHSGASPFRGFQIDVRVGDYAFDNSNVERGGGSVGGGLPLDADYDAIRRTLWLTTDAAYKRATETLERKRAVAKGETKDPDDAGSFSKEPPLHVIDEPPLPTDEVAPLEALAKKLSAVFRTNADAYSGTAAIHAGRGRLYFLSSESSAAVEPQMYAKVELACSTQAADGMPLRSAVTLWGDAAGKLPPEAELVAAADKLSRELSARRAAPIVDDYAGPILFTGLAADQVLRVLLAENFGGSPAPKSGRAGGHDVAESELVGKVGQRILPLGMSIVDDPHVRFDEDGVVAQKVSLVENGTFKRFLMSRIPRKGFEHSNGHGYTAPAGGGARAHPTNLIVTSTKAISDAALRKQALAAAKDGGSPYIVVVERFEEGASELEGSLGASGGTLMPHPAVMKKLFADGHEELVRGGTLGSITLRSLRDILAVGQTATTYRYFGAGYAGMVDMFYDGTSGYPVSISAPALLFRDAEVKKPLGAQRTPPIAPKP